MTLLCKYFDLISRQRRTGFPVMKHNDGGFYYLVDLSFYNLLCYTEDANTLYRMLPETYRLRFFYKMQCTNVVYSRLLRFVFEARVPTVIVFHHA